MSSIFQRGLSWHSYLNLERDFIDVTRYVALDKNHGGVWSDKIAQLLLLTGSTVDSVFNEMRMSSFLEEFKPVIDLRQKSEPNIRDYREVYDPIYQLSNVELRARYGLAEYGIISPFQPFALDKSPEWWNAYNDVKHGFFQNMIKGTLDNLIHALGALFTLNVLHKDSQQYLATTGVIRVGYPDRNMSLLSTGSDIWSFLKGSFVPPWGGTTLEAWATSEVFFYVLGSRPKPQLRSDQ